MLLLIIVLMVALGRIDSAQGDVESAARAGVQAAVVQADAADAQTEATSAAISTLAGAGLTCPSPQISTDTSNFVAGGTVSVTRHLCDQPGRRVGPRSARVEDADRDGHRAPR